MADAIPQQALARAVRAAFGAGARIVAAEPLFGDASSRRYVRLRLADGGAPPTVVAMLLGADRFPLGSDELGERAASDELPFANVARYLAARGFAVPTIHRDASASDSLLLLEDVGDTTLWAAASARPADARPLFEAAVDLLAAFQVAGARHPDPSCLAFRRRFDGRLARWELEHFVEHGIETRHGRSLAANERAGLLAALDPLARPFEQGAPVLVHRDFMAWNLHVRDGRLHLIDFQDALLGPDAYDLAALLTDRTTGTLVTPALEAELIRHFGRAPRRSPTAPRSRSSRWRAGPSSNTSSSSCAPAAFARSSSICITSAGASRSTWATARASGSASAIRGRIRSSIREAASSGPSRSLPASRSWC